MTMGNFKELINILSKIKVSDKRGNSISFDKATSRISDCIITRCKEGNKIMLIGNGGSASIASHISTDFLKNAGCPAIVFHDSSLITCVSNDLGYERVFKKPVEVLAKKGDILFSISSSGKSENILGATAAAKKQGCFLVTLSGFRRENPLKKLGDINFYVSSKQYGHVEITHLAICHLIVDKIILDKRRHGYIQD